MSAPSEGGSPALDDPSSAPRTKKWRGHLLVKTHGLPVLLATQRLQQSAASTTSQGLRGLAEQVRNVARFALEQMCSNLFYRHYARNVPVELPRPVPAILGSG